MVGHSGGATPSATARSMPAGIAANRSVVIVHAYGAELVVPHA
ncbi:hypothetical protein [Streptosporangium sp. NPDC049644]